MTITQNRQSKLTNYLSAYLPPVIWAGFIFFLSNQPNLPGIHFSTLDFLFKKSAHMGVYGVLYLFLHRALLKTKASYSARTHWYIPVALCLVYAISDELHQSFIINRHASAMDIGYDMLGVTTMYLYTIGYI